ncbi:MAG: DUF1624 domain-containing protein [Pseudomonadota bacterium]
MSTSYAPTEHSKRVILIDVARGTALAAMVVYHFTWDLEFFGYVQQGLTAYGGWKMFARLIAGSFLFLVGVSLVLGHSDAIRWRSFAVRLAMIVAAAAAITGVTVYAMPDRFIFFGILHNIAVSSILGLAFLRLPAIVSLAGAIIVLFGKVYFAAPVFNHWALLWLGLSTDRVVSNDYVPVFPWFGVVLLGIGTAKIAKSAGLFTWLAAIYRSESRIGKPLAFAGRHSLAVYLLHQPVLIGLVYIASLVYPAPAADPIASITFSCNRVCSEDNPDGFCQRYCRCVAEGIVEADLLDTLTTIQSSGEPDAELRQITAACTASAIEQGGSE